MRFHPHLLAVLFFRSCMLPVLCYEHPAPDPISPTTNPFREADPQKNITCLGEYSATGKSMQKLCAHPFYGGSTVGANFQGYCHEGDVFFSTIERGSGFDHYLRRAVRNYLECRNRCFCNYGLEGPSQQPRHVAATRKTFDNSDDNPKWAMALDTMYVATRAMPNPLTRLYLLTAKTRTGYPLTGFEYLKEDVGIAPMNKITCTGALPDFPLPHPYEMHEFANNQALCATQLSGGTPFANTGAYCHVSFGSGSDEDGEVVSFEDHHTPRLDWTWNPGSTAAFFKVAAVRFHCWKNCLCSHRTRRRNYVDPMLGMWERLLEKTPGDSISVSKGSRYPMGSSTDANGVIRTSYRGGGSGSQRCAASPGEPGSCGIPWPVDVLGPVPKVVMEIAVSQPQPPPAVEAVNQKKVCGNRCSGMSDCGGDCLCRMPSMEEIRTLGVDPVAPTALCMGLVSVFGREVGGLEEQVECLCNATYTAPACCHFRDGMVLLD